MPTGSISKYNTAVRELAWIQTKPFTVREMAETMGTHHPDLVEEHPSVQNLPRLQRAMGLKSICATILSVECLRRRLKRMNPGKRPTQYAPLSVGGGHLVRRKRTKRQTAKQTAKQNGTTAEVGGVVWTSDKMVMEWGGVKITLERPA